MRTREQELACRIAKELFTDSLGRKVQRLVEEFPDKKIGGGYCESAVRDLVLKILQSPLNP